MTGLSRHAGSVDVTERDYLEQLLDEQRAAEFMGVSPRTLQNWRLRGGGPRFVRRSNRFVRYRRKDLIDWVERHAVTNTSE